LLAPGLFRQVMVNCVEVTDVTAISPGSLVEMFVETSWMSAAFGVKLRPCVTVTDVVPLAITAEPVAAVTTP
jgi:hypothetical protein